MERRRQSLSSKPSKASLPNSASTSQLSSLGAGDGISGSSTVRSASPQPQMVQEGGAGSNSSEPITMGQIVCLLCDASTLQEKVSGSLCSGCSGFFIGGAGVHFPSPLVCSEKCGRDLMPVYRWKRGDVYALICDAWSSSSSQLLL